MMSLNTLAEDKLVEHSASILEDTFDANSLTSSPNRGIHFKTSIFDKVRSNSVALVLSDIDSGENTTSI